MIVLDTNVISELMRREPDPMVMAWIDDHVVFGRHMAVSTDSPWPLGVMKMVGSLTESLRLMALQANSISG